MMSGVDSSKMKLLACTADIASTSENIKSKEEILRKFMQVEWKSCSLKDSPKVRKIISGLLEAANNSLKYLEEIHNKSQLDFKRKKKGRKSRTPKKENDTEDEAENGILFTNYCDDKCEDVCLVHRFLHYSKAADGLRSEFGYCTCPAYLSLFRYGTKHAKLGVMSEVKLPQDIVFGPFLGSIVNCNRAVKSYGYSWPVGKFGGFNLYVEGSDPFFSNWLRFVNCPESEERQNLIAFRHDGKIYYKTCKEIEPYTELQVWYGDKYARDFGIRPRNKNKPAEKKAMIQGFECNICHVMCCTEDWLKRHMKSCHKEPSSNGKFKCFSCPYSTSNTGHLKYHLQMHNKERPYRCKQCGKRFTMRSNLNVHIRIHTGENPYQCSTCGKGFNQKTNMRNHEIRHLGKSMTQPFVCTTCGSKFPSKMDHDKHTFIHTGQKPFKCPHCHFRTCWERSMPKHIIYMHTRKFPFVCFVCGSGFVQPSHLRTHVNKNHRCKQGGTFVKDVKC